MAFESYNVSIDDFPKMQAIALEQINGHKGSNLCIQIVYFEDTNGMKYTHNYFSVNDPSHVEIPDGLDESKGFISNHFHRPPETLCYINYNAVGDMTFSHGVKNVILCDCHVPGTVILPPGATLHVKTKNILTLKVKS